MIFYRNINLNNDIEYNKRSNYSSPVAFSWKSYKMLKTLKLPQNIANNIDGV